MMNKEVLIEKLMVIVKPYIQNEEAFSKMNEETDFINDLEVNSANLVDIILDTEDEFDIRIEDEDMDRMINVASAIEVIEEKLSAK
jgi:acyl carrier protein